MTPEKSTPRYIIIKLSKIKDKETVESGKGEEIHHIQGHPHEYQQVVQQKPHRPEESKMIYSKC